MTSVVLSSEEASGCKASAASFASPVVCAPYIRVQNWHPVSQQSPCRRCAAGIGTNFAEACAKFLLLLACGDNSVCMVPVVVAVEPRSLSVLPCRARAMVRVLVRCRRHHLAGLPQSQSLLQTPRHRSSMDNRELAQTNLDSA